jgi:hypothetical protein
MATGIACRRFVSRKLTVKADSSAVTIYDQHHEIVTYICSWQRGQTFGAERLRKSCRRRRPAAERSATQQRLIALLGPAAHEYLEQLANTEVRCHGRCAKCLRWFENGPEAIAPRSRKRTPREAAAPITSPISLVSSNSGTMCSSRGRSEIRR